MMARLGIALTLLAASACTTSAVAVVHCADDSTCPFQQCCVGGSCVDPGPIGACGTPDLGQSTLTVTSATVAAGTDDALAIDLRDIHGRPMTGVAADVLVQSNCNGCNLVTLNAPLSDATGSIGGVFSSTVAEDKTLTLRVGSVLGPPVTVHVVPGVATSVGVASAIADTPVTDALQVVATRLDAYGNPDAPAGPNAMVAPQVVVQLDANAGGLVFTDATGVPLTAAQRTVTLSQPHLLVPGLYVPLVAHGIAILTTTNDTTLTSTTSAPFSVVAPIFTSAMPDPLATTGSNPVTLDWTVTPTSTAAQVVEDDTGVTAATPPMSYAPDYSGEAPNLTHLRIEPVVHTMAHDVEVAVQGADHIFTSPSSRAPNGVNLLDFSRFANGDFLVVGQFTNDVRLGVQGASNITATPVLNSGFEAFVARLDPTLHTLRWNVLFYSINDATHGVNVTIRDSEVTSADDVIVEAEYNGLSAGWQYIGAGATHPVMRCTHGGATGALFSTSVAHIQGSSGIVSSCNEMHDPTNATSVRAGAVATVGGYHYATVRANADFNVYPGNTVTVTGSTALVATDPTTGTAVSVGTLANDVQCAGLGVSAFLPFDDAGVVDVSNATVPLMISAVAMDVTKLVADVDNKGFIVSATACSAGGHPLQVGGATSTFVTVRNDAVAMRADVVVAAPPAAGAQLHLIWQSACASNETAVAAEPFGTKNIVVVAAFNATCALPSGTTSSPGGTALFAGMVTRSSGTLAWALPMSSPTGITGVGLSVRGDRFVFVATAAESITLGATLHATHDTNPSQSDPVGIAAELSPSGAIRWSSQLAGAATASRPIALADGTTMLAVNGSEGSVVVGPLDANPARQADATGGRLEPVVGLLVPSDYVSRDVTRP